MGRTDEEIRAAREAWMKGDRFGVGRPGRGVAADVLTQAGFDPAALGLFVPVAAVVGYLAIAVYYLVPLGQARRQRRIHQAMAPHRDQGRK
ncbi:hypothetical protein AB0F57_17195 [Streptomyces tanashiensis]|uniref:hypothetical protein n=1 Tax=Streptomyces tanashiensis TaxID=67367 RepID=UPI0034012A1D